MHVETLGSGPRLVLVHGSVAPEWMTRNAQKPLAERFTLVVPVRSGYPPNPPLEHIDFEAQARELEDVIPLDELAATTYPKLVVSGAHSAAFDAVADVLEQRLGAKRAVLPGAGHSIPRVGEPLTALISAFVRQAPGTVPEGDSP